MHQWLVNHISTRHSLDILYDNFKYSTIRAESDGSCRGNLGIFLAAWRLESKYGNQLIEGGGMVPGSPADKNSFIGELGGQLLIPSFIHSLEGIIGSSPLVMNCCDHFSALRKSNIHP